MSITVMTEVWTSSLPTATHKLVLLAFADHASDEGVCWPSMRLISWKTGLGRRQTTRIVQGLIANGALEVISESRPRRSRRYRVRADKLTALPDRRADTADPTGGSACLPREDTADPPEGTSVSPEPSKEPSIESTSGTRDVRSIYLPRRADHRAKGPSRPRLNGDDDRIDWLEKRFREGKRRQPAARS